MGRKARPTVFRVRYKDNFGIRSRLVIGKSPRKAPGRVLKINKVSLEEVFHVGEYNRMPENLMKEFKKGGDNSSFSRVLNSVEQELNLNKEVV